MNDELKHKEADRFFQAFAKVAPDKTDALRKLLTASGSERSAFYFGLTAFGRDFVGLDGYVGARVATLLTDVQRKIATYLAMVHHYAQQTLPSKAFAGLLGFPRGQLLPLEKHLPWEFMELLVRAESGEWRMGHELFAEACLRQLLGAGTADRDGWKDFLSATAIEFIEFTRGESQTPGVRMIELVRDMFVSRDHAMLLSEDPGGGHQYAPVIKDIPVVIGKENVLRKLTEVYPVEAHFHAHLARFYGLHGRHADARRAIEEALQKEPDDPTLHHMRGMTCKYQAQDLIAERKPLLEVLAVAREATASFTESRVRRPDNEHGYISEVQLRIRVLDYAAADARTTAAAAVAAAAADPYVRESFDVAEGLLAQVRVIRQGERQGQYELDCRNRLNGLYGDTQAAVQGWRQLLGRPGVAKAPVRRQILWTLLRSYGGNWSQLRDSKNDFAQVSRVLDENITESHADSASFRLWLRAQRIAPKPWPLDRVIEKVSYWWNTTDDVEAAFYLYILQLLKTLEGSPTAKADTETAIRYCQDLARGNRTRTHTAEWLGKGTGVQQLVHDSDLGEWVDDFRANKHLLVRLSGRVAEVNSPQSGKVYIGDTGLKAFFIPHRAGLDKGDLNVQLTFYLGFRYEGPMAWDPARVSGPTQPSG